MTPEFWATVIIAAVGFLGSVAVQLIVFGKLRGEFRSVMKNFPPHRHVNGSILYSAEYEPTELERPRG